MFLERGDDVTGGIDGRTRCRGLELQIEIEAARESGRVQYPPLQNTVSIRASELSGSTPFDAVADFRFVDRRLSWCRRQRRYAAAGG